MNPGREDQRPVSRRGPGKRQATRLTEAASGGRDAAKRAVEGDGKRRRANNRKPMVRPGESDRMAAKQPQRGGVYAMAPRLREQRHCL